MNYHNIPEIGCSGVGTNVCPTRGKKLVNSCLLRDEEHTHTEYGFVCSKESAHKLILETICILSLYEIAHYMSCLPLYLTWDDTTTPCAMWPPPPCLHAGNNQYYKGQQKFLNKATIIPCYKFFHLHLSIRPFSEWVVYKFWTLLGYTVVKVCASPRNSTWFTRLQLLTVKLLL